MIKKILLVIVSIIVLAVIGIYIYVQSSWDKTYDWPGPSLKTSTDSSVIARGKYLVEGPAHCVSCHISSFADIVAADQGQDSSIERWNTISDGSAGCHVHTQPYA